MTLCISLFIDTEIMRTQLSLKNTQNAGIFLNQIGGDTSCIRILIRYI